MYKSAKNRGSLTNILTIDIIMLDESDTEIELDKPRIALII